jgi:hypothetical protein
MRANNRRAFAPAVAAAILSCVMSGCGGTSTPQARATPDASTSAPSSTPPASTPWVSAPPAGAGPLTGEERVWLESIATVHRRVDKALSELPCCTDRTELRALQRQLHRCTRELVRKGARSARLRPVRALVKQACTRYDKGAKCFAAAAAIGIPLAGSPAERKLSAAINCGFSAPGRGTALLADAESKGDEVRRRAS